MHRGPESVCIKLSPTIASKFHCVSFCGFQQTLETPNYVYWALTHPAITPLKSRSHKIWVTSFLIARMFDGRYAKFQTVWRFLYTNPQLWKLMIRVFVCWQELVVTREFSDVITTFTNRDLVNQHMISDAVKWLQPHKSMRWNYPSIPLFRQTTVVVRAWMGNRLVLQMRAALGGLSRTSGKLSQDCARCYMFLNLKRNIF